MKIPGISKKKQTADMSGRRRASSERTPVFSYYNYSGQRRAASTQDSTRVGTRVQTGNGTQTKHASGPRSVAGHTFAWRYVPTYAVLLVFVAAFVYVLSLSSDPRVVIQQQPGIVQRDTAVYESEVRALWRKSLRNHSKITADTNGTRQSILNDYRELADVRVQLPLVGRRATIVLVPASPVLQVQAQNGMYYVDAHGKALVDTSHVEQTSSVPTVRDESVLMVDPGKTVLPGSQVVFIVQLVAELQAVNLPLQSLTLSDKAVNELDVRLDGQGYFIKMQMQPDSDVRQIVGAYVAARKKMDGDGVRPGEYVDVRIPDKVFYK